MQKKAFSFAVGPLLLSAGAVSAATLTDNLNLRSGPGLRYDVIGAVPAGSDVRVMNCVRSGGWVNDAQGYVADYHFGAVRFSGFAVNRAASHLARLGYYAQTQSLPGL
jgi:hypothetical protein